MTFNSFSSTPSEDTVILEANRPAKHYWADLWRYRYLFQVLAWSDVAVRYKQTIMGIAWAVVRPFVTMIVFTVVFGKLAGLPSEGNIPYALMVFAGVLPWQLFSSSLSGCAESIAANAGLISKVYFPRLILPSAAVTTAVIDFLMSSVILFGLMVWYRFVPGWQIVLLPAFLLIVLAASIGPGLWLASLNVKYRDFRYVIPFILQLGVYVSPIGFSSTVVPEKWRLLYSINPLVGVIDGFRWCVLGGQSAIYWPGLVLSVVIIGILLRFGISRFRLMEKTFADVI